MNLLAVGVVYACFLAGVVMPDLWWGTHYTAFLSPLWQVAILGASLTVFAYAYLKRHDQSPMALKVKLEQLIYPVSILMGVLMFACPIDFDFYGDAYAYLDRLYTHDPVIPSNAFDGLFSYSLSPWAGQKTILAVITYLMYYMGITYHTAFLIMDAVCGVVFVFVWYKLVLFLVRDTAWRVLAILMGITSPFMLNYFGHVEIYAPILTMTLVWLAVAIRYWQHGSKKHVWLLFGLLLVAVKLYAALLLLGPVLLLFTIRYYGKPDMLQWKGIALYLILPIYLVGAVVYFFVVGDHSDERMMRETAMEFDRLFLPLLSPAPPHDRYNLLSFNHIFDYFNMILIWAPIGLVVVLLAAAYWRKINWNHGLIIISALAFLLMASLFFVINPLLSMQIDWDMMCAPAPAFLVFCLVLVSGVEKQVNGKRLLVGVVSIVIISVSAFIMHSSKPAISARLESLGQRMYFTYYEWSAKYINEAISMDPDTMRHVQRRENVIEKLRPYGVPGKDYELQRMLDEQASFYLRSLGQPRQAMDYLSEAAYYYPYDPDLHILFMETHFELQEFDLAYRYSENLLRTNYPTAQKALSAVIHCALEAGEYSDALKYSEVFNRQWSNEVMQEVERRLVEREDLDGIKFMFK